MLPEMLVLEKATISLVFCLTKMKSTMPLYPCTWLDHSHIIKSVFVVHVQ